MDLFDSQTILKLISNVFSREDYRHVSYLGKIGLKGYEMAVESFL